MQTDMLITHYLTNSLKLMVHGILYIDSLYLDLIACVERNEPTTD